LLPVDDKVLVLKKLCGEFFSTNKFVNFDVPYFRIHRKQSSTFSSGSKHTKEVSGQEYIMAVRAQFENSNE
jgi:hypothetical protein